MSGAISYQWSSSTTTSADRYNPMPNTVWVPKLFNRALAGLGVFDEATPNPSDGWRTKNGNTTVITPNKRAGRRVGLMSQFLDTIVTKLKARASPIE